MLTFDLPWPPSVNHYYRRVGPRMLISRQGREFRRQVGLILAGQGITPLVGHLAVRIEAFPPDRRKRDADNLLKAVVDALQHGGVFPDDSHIVWLLIVKAKVVPGGRATVSVCDLAEEPPPATTWDPSWN